jgi:UDP-N-acetylmuramoyl-tripeptide--D-alanyl-D-alanine ligase
MGTQWSAQVPAVGRHIAINAAAAVLAAQVIGVDPVTAGQYLGNAVLPPMRMEVVEREGTTYLLDTYNASPPSMIAAIETLSELPAIGKRRAVIGEMKELGVFTIDAHCRVGEALAISQITELLLYGEATQDTYSAAIRSGFPESMITVANSIEEVATFLRRSEAGDVVLIKGSRSLELERALDWRTSH